ncbi:MAG: hypothetical protein WC626_08965 [Methanoregula sp.]
MKDTPETLDLLRGMRHELKERFIPVPFCPVFSCLSGKPDPHIRVLLAFPGAGWGEI